MGKVKLTSSVRIQETGEETTIAKLADEGRVRFTKSERWSSPKSKTGYRTAYWAELLPEKNEGIEGCWEISPTAYQSRTGEQVKGSATSEPEPKPQPESGRIGISQSEWLKMIYGGDRPPKRSE